MNNIQKTAIRLIANAYLFGREKERNCYGYRFDSSYLSNRGITSTNDLSSLQEELNRRGWVFNVINFNDFVIQNKMFLAEMTKLGFGRIKNRSDEEALSLYNDSMYKSYSEKIASFVKGSIDECNLKDNKLTFIKENKEHQISFSYEDSKINEYFTSLTVKLDGNSFIYLDIFPSYTSLKEVSSKIISFIKDNV